MRAVALSIVALTGSALAQPPPDGGAAPVAATAPAAAPATVSSTAPPTAPAAPAPEPYRVKKRFFISAGGGASRLHSSDARCDDCRHRFGLGFDADVGYVISGRVALVLGFAIRQAEVVDDRVEGFDLAGVGSATAGVEVALQRSTWIQAGAGIGMFDFMREAEGGSITAEDGAWLVTRVSAGTELVTFDSVALTAALTVDGYLQGDAWAIAPMLGLSIRYSNLVVENPFSGDGPPCNFDPSKGCRGHGDE